MIQQVSRGGFHRGFSRFWRSGAPRVKDRFALRLDQITDQRVQPTLQSKTPG